MLQVVTKNVSGGFLFAKVWLEKRCMLKLKYAALADHESPML
jgi:hypothetical protein